MTEDNHKMVQMTLVDNPVQKSTSAKAGDLPATVNFTSSDDANNFVFTMQPRYNAARTVSYALRPADAQTLHDQLSLYLGVPVADDK